MDQGIALRTGEFIPLSALEFATSRSGGPGGQNVNKVETKVEVRFVIADALFLSESTRTLLLSKLQSKLDTTGTLRVASSTERSQLGNRRRAVERLGDMLNRALTPVKKRKPTQPTTASREKRLDSKRKTSEKKSSRKWREDS